MSTPAVREVAQPTIDAGYRPLLTAGFAKELLGLTMQLGIDEIGTPIPTMRSDEQCALWYGAKPNRSNEVPVITSLRNMTTAADRSLLWFCGVAPYVSDMGDNRSLQLQHYADKAAHPVRTSREAVAGAYILTYGIGWRKEDWLLNYFGNQ